MCVDLNWIKSLDVGWYYNNGNNDTNYNVNVVTRGIMFSVNHKHRRQWWQQHLR